MTYESSEWCWPLPTHPDGRKPVISDPFHPKNSTQRGGLGHRGQDVMYMRRVPGFQKLPWRSRWYEMRPRTPVLAANHGFVFRCGKIQTGWHVIVSHGEQQGTGYYHMSELSPGIIEGVPLRMGQPLGIVGWNPIEDAYALAHLHFDVAIAGHFIDASKVMKTWHYERP